MTRAMTSSVEHNVEHTASEPGTAGGELRVGYLVSQYPAINHTFILREIRALRENGIDVDVVSIRPTDRPAASLSPVEREEHVRTFYVKTVGVAGALAPHLRMLATSPLRYVAGLLSALRLSRGRPTKIVPYLAYFAEAVIVGRWMAAKDLRHLHVHFSSTVALILARMFDVGISITIHGPAEFDDPSAFHMAEKVASSEFISVISNFARSQVMLASDASDWNKIDVCPLGVDTSAFRPRPSPSSAGPFEIICVGRLAAVKAQRVLIGAVDRVRNAGHSVRLRLVGDGPDRAALERLVVERGLEKVVVFEGWQNQERVHALYERADVFALASFAEGVPVVLMEAMAMEIPCVATCITGVPELIRHRVDGLLVPASDESAFADALIELIGDAGLRHRLGKAARRRVQECYELETNTRRFADVIRVRLSPSVASIAASAVTRAE